MTVCLLCSSCQEKKQPSKQEVEQIFKVNTHLRLDFLEPLKLRVKLTKPSASGEKQVIRAYEVDGTNLNQKIGLNTPGIYDLEIGTHGSFPIVLTDLDSVLAIQVQINPFSYEVIKGQNSAHFESYLKRFGPDRSYGFKSKVQFLDSISPSPAGAYLYDFELTNYADFYVPSFGLIRSKYQSKAYGHEVVDKIQELTFGELGYGKPIPDFKLPEFKQKNQVGPADFRGKYLLIDFWASWCGPCRQENPNVKAAYKEWKSKGFEVLGVSTDRSAANWELAIQQDEITWHQVLDLNGQVSEQYGIQSIPTVYMVDPNGQIIGKNVRGSRLEELLEFYLAK